MAWSSGGGARMSSSRRTATQVCWNSIITLTPLLRGCLALLGLTCLSLRPHVPTFPSTAYLLSATHSTPRTSYTPHLTFHTSPQPTPHPNPPPPTPSYPTPSPLPRLPGEHRHTHGTYYTLEPHPSTSGVGYEHIRPHLLLRAVCAAEVPACGG
jgi:hypothetical protein